MTMTTPAKIEPVRIHGQFIRLAETARNVWHVRAHDGHSPDDCVNPAYLWHRHNEMKVGDKVEIAHEHGDFYMELLVARIDRETQGIQTRIIMAQDWRAEELPAVDLSGAAIEKSGDDGWRVVLGNSVLIKGMATKAEAQSWLDKKRGKQPVAA